MYAAITLLHRGGEAEMITFMERAAVLIGVKRTGDLPVLQDATRSARRMEVWAKGQGVQHVAVFTDEDGKKVKISAIKDEISKLARRGTVDQLIVFFAGHGINLNRGERWLLSDAPADSQAAVNVRGSADLASYGTIPYVVMISDACRTAAQSIQAQGVTGSEIFPNLDKAEFELPVDQFFACRLGRSAHEIIDVNTTAREYKAIYTRALVDALSGHGRLVLDDLGYVRPRPLQAFLRLELARRLRDLDLQTKVIQNPDAHIASGDEEWISYLGSGAGSSGEGGGRGGASGGGRAGARGGGRGPSGGGGGAKSGGRRKPPDADYTRRPSRDPLTREEDILPGALGAADVLWRSVISDKAVYLEKLRENLGSVEPEVAQAAAEVERQASPFGPTNFDTHCGFTIRGACVREAWSRSVDTEQLTESVIRVHPGHRRGGSVLLVLESREGLVLPAIREFVTSITVDGDDVVGVAYEPSEGTERWAWFSERASEVRRLRSVAAAASREGVFELDGDEAYDIARRMQYVKAIDPALAVYAAYAFADVGRRDVISEMEGVMRNDLGAAFFDVALLARRRRGSPRQLSAHDTFGFSPLLAQGWALLPAVANIGPWVRELEQHLVPTSLWTLYDEGGVEMVRSAFIDGAVE